MRERFWERFALEELDEHEWEALCDGCGQCCLVRLEDEESGDIATLSLACRLLDSDAVRCRDYPNRLSRAEGCLQLTPERVRRFYWLPQTCGYRRVARGETLPAWHPLISGDPMSVHRAGISVRGMTISEDAVDEQDYEDYIIAVLPIEG
ncbi:YcgN family cysteine cluster protein [Kushneria aurantia]|uniref:UPF0260 protein ACFFHW_17140 n=1 Tax=Kushneria aurantia TaxID=504092 RepID=A0ABV6G7P6_9GAMM|nr:YcgN family cysteine cluster protein [Kushneria aurantia]